VDKTYLNLARVLYVVAESDADLTRIRPWLKTAIEVILKHARNLNAPLGDDVKPAVEALEQAMDEVKKAGFRIPVPLIFHCWPDLDIDIGHVADDAMMDRLRMFV
jgi:hypothetical protein